MSERIVVLRDDDPLPFVEDACAAAADAVNEIRLAGPAKTDLDEVYAELVGALARLRRSVIAAGPSGQIRVKIVDHLLMRLHEASEGQVAIRIVDIADRLHGELTSDKT